MKKNYLVSIIVPTFNAENTIEKCIYSIGQQSYTYIEIIIVDDGSKDGTFEKCLKLQDNDKRIKLFKQENAGPSAARNTGLDNAKGEYILFVDSDDWIESTCIEDAVTVSLEKGADVVLWNFVREINNQQKKNTPLVGESRDFSNEQFEELLSKVLCYESEIPGMSNLSITGPVCKLFSRRLIGKIRFPEELSLGEDLCFLLKLSPYLNKVSYVSKYYYHLLVHKGSLTQKWDVNFAKKKSDFVNMTLKIIEARKGYSDSCKDKFVFENYLTVTERYLFGSKEVNYFERIKYINNYIDSVERKINYANIRHKCAPFMFHKIYLPIYVIGKVSRKY